MTLEKLKEEIQELLPYADIAGPDVLRSGEVGVYITIRVGKDITWPQKELKQDKLARYRVVDALYGLADFFESSSQELRDNAYTLWKRYRNSERITHERESAYSGRYHRREGAGTLP